MNEWDAARLNAHIEDESKVTPEARNKVLARDGWSCLNCYEEDLDKLTVHHVLFRSRGGGHLEDNLVTLCGRCHGMLHHGKLALKKIKGRYYISAVKLRLGVINSESTVDNDRLRRYYRRSLDRWKKEAEFRSVRTSWKKIR